MAGAEERAVRKLEKQIARTQERLTKAGSKKRRCGGLFGGVILGTVAGGLLTYYLTQRNQDDEWEQERADDAILLREQPAPTGQTAVIKPLPKLNVATEQRDSNDVAATTLEETGAAAEPAQAAQGAARPAAPTGEAPAPAEQPQQAAAPALAKQDEQPAKAPAPARAEQPAKAEAQPKEDAPLPVEIEHPEIVVAKASGNTDEVLAEATSNEPAPAPPEIPVEPVDGV